MSYEIVKVSPNEHHILNEFGEVLATYTRMSDAKRGLSRLLKRQQAKQATSELDFEQEESASVSATGAAQATRVAETVAHPPLVTRGDKLRRRWRMMSSSRRRK